MIVLAVHVGGDGAPEGDLAGSGRDRDEPALWDCHGEKFIDGDTRSDAHDTVGGDGADSPEGAIIEHHSSTALCGVAVTAAQPPRYRSTGFFEFAGHCFFWR